MSEEERILRLTKDEWEYLKDELKNQSIPDWEDLERAPPKDWEVRLRLLHRIEKKIENDLSEEKKE